MKYQVTISRSPYLEARLESWLEDKKSELKCHWQSESQCTCKEHAMARGNQNMLYSGGTLLDAMRAGESLNLKKLGLQVEAKLAPRDGSLYLYVISHIYDHGSQ